MRDSKIFAERVQFGRYINIHMAVHDGDGKSSVARPVVFDVIEDLAATFSPMLQLDPRDAQKLADQLWVAGIRPTQSLPSEGQVGATDRHLQDMRALVAALAKVQLP